MRSDVYNLTAEFGFEATDSLTFPRAVRLVEAVNRHRDFTLHHQLRKSLEGEAAFECLIVDVAVDGIPSTNTAGIEYREPLALLVHSDASHLVEVWALRRSFPCLMHQNATPPNFPKDLCLYFEPVKSILRIWTAEKFLRRIQWWLENSAKGTLHAADQPAEQLFFVTKFELVLPWNFDDLRKAPGARFGIEGQPKRPNGDKTYLLKPAAPEQKRALEVIQVDLSPVLQGQIIEDPFTLGRFQEVMELRGVDPIPEIKCALASRVSEKGEKAAPTEDMLVLLLNIPIVAESGGAHLRVQRRAYVLNGNLLELGVKLGTLFKHEGTYFDASGVKDNPEGDWRSETLLAAEVLFMNAPTAFRKQSGIQEEGPKATLVGAGSLGSKLLEFWGRAGWGTWTAVDNDHVKPHNLSRHVAFAGQVGFPKADVVSYLHHQVTGGASVVQSVDADAMAFEREEVRAAVETAQLVVDASTTLEYPRTVSGRDGVGRHASVFITPSGDDGVLLMEDSKRLTRLRTLEAQYYRLVINSEFGEAHLAGNSSTFWSGAGCRDMSLVIPYSRIAVHAGNLAEQVRLAFGRDEGCIKVWQRNQDTGAVVLHTVAVESEATFDLGAMKLYLDEGVKRRLHELRAAAMPNETGGVLLGYYDLNEQFVVVVDALAAPPDSKSSPIAFERGVHGLATAVEEASRRTAQVVAYVGEWHSHPKGHPTAPSADDLFQMVHLALEMSADGLPALQLIVGDDGIQVGQGMVS